MTDMVEEKPQLAPIGEEIDRLYALRSKIKELTAKYIEPLETEFELQEQALMARLLEQGIESISGKTATVFIKVSEVPQVDNWEDFHRYIRRNNAFQLLNKAVNAAAWRELMSQRGPNKPLPGVVTYTKRALNLRKA